jgi:hypothetical protein
MVFQVVPKADSPRRTVRTRFPLRIAAGMTEFGLLQEPLLFFNKFFAISAFFAVKLLIILPEMEGNSLCLQNSL